MQSQLQTRCTGNDVALDSEPIICVYQHSQLAIIMVKHRNIFIPLQYLTPPSEFSKSYKKRELRKLE